MPLSSDAIVPQTTHGGPVGWLPRARRVEGMTCQYCGRLAPRDAAGEPTSADQAVSGER